MEVDTIGYVQGWGDPFGLGQRAGGVRGKGARGEILEVGRGRQARTARSPPKGRGGERIARRPSANGGWFAIARAPFRPL